MNLKKQAFTLVELVVVITILAILWTIAFISLQWYSKSSRDSVRLVDTSNMKTSLELFHLNSGKYPLPDNPITFTYLWDDVYYQWYFWDNVVQNLSRNISMLPLDPLTEKKYIYSIWVNKNELEILALMEWDNIWFNSLTLQTNAEWLSVTPLITWNYNWLFVKTPTYIVPLPSIINADISEWSTIEFTDDNIKSMVTDLWENVPEHWNVSSNTWALTWLVLTWALNDLTKKSSDEDKAAVMEVIQAAYVNESSLNTEWIYEYVLSLWTDETLLAAAFNTTVLNESSIDIVTTSNSCNDSTKPADDLNKTYTVNPTSVNQAYVQGGGECWYSCTWWYEWSNCEAAPNLYGSCDWLNNWSVFSAVTTYWDWTGNECDTPDITVCSWNNAWYTISACNVWTNTWWTSTDSYWELFQWWNNAWLRTAWTSTGQILVTATWSTFSSDTFIYSSRDWNSSYNDNLWWNATNTNESRIWPCLTWYHVPTSPEWTWIRSAWWWGSSSVNMRNALKIPMSGQRTDTTAVVQLETTYSFFWSSTPSSSWFAKSIYFDNSNIFMDVNGYRAYGFSVRCFKN